MFATSGAISTPGMGTMPLKQKSALRPFAPGAIENVFTAMLPASTAYPRQSTTVPSAPVQELVAWQLGRFALDWSPEPWKRIVIASEAVPVGIGLGVCSAGEPLNIVLVTEFGWLL